MMADSPEPITEYCEPWRALRPVLLRLAKRDMQDTFPEEARKIVASMYAEVVGFLDDLAREEDCITERELFELREETKRLRAALSS
jgi:hypothetical protein